jgi:hypothetical protein
MATHVETGRARRQYVQEAGWKTVSGVSVLAGTLVALGAIALVAAGAGAAGSALGLDTEGFSTDEWRRAGVVSGAIGAIVVLVSFWFGGYTAGRMSRRAGARHGLLVFLLSVLLLGAVALVSWAVGDSGAVNEALQDNGVPTDESTWSDIGLGAGIAAVLAMLLGALLGGLHGDRWHGRLATAVVEARDARELASHDHEHDDHDGQHGDETAVVDRTWTADRQEVDLTDDDRTEISVEEQREIARS